MQNAYEYIERPFDQKEDLEEIDDLDDLEEEELDDMDDLDDPEEFEENPETEELDDIDDLDDLNHLDYLEKNEANELEEFSDFSDLDDLGYYQADGKVSDDLDDDDHASREDFDDLDDDDDHASREDFDDLDDDDDHTSQEDSDDLDDDDYYNTSEEDFDDLDDDDYYNTSGEDADDLDDDTDEEESPALQETAPPPVPEESEPPPQEEQTDSIPQELIDSDYLDDFDEMDYDESDEDIYDEWYDGFQEVIHQFDQDTLFSSLNTLLHQSRNEFAVNRKLMQKTIDVSWVEAIENGLVHIDNFLRAPRRTIEDVEEIVPIALSRKITVESVKHLAQHTDLIQSFDQKTGKITPSKILNVHKEESLMTYENKFVNTLIDRLYLFINIRYEKLAQVAKDEQAYILGYDTDIDDGSGGKFKIEIKMETISSLDTYNENGYTIWERVEKLKRIIEGYKGSELCTKLGNTYIRPPVMRTNAIMKNVDLKACLTLWQYIESYDKTGYEINIEDSAVQPESSYIEDFYRMVIFNLILFRAHMMGQETAGKLNILETRHRERVKPAFVRKFDDHISDDYTVIASGAAGYIAADGVQKITKKIPKDVNLLYDQIAKVIKIEKAYQADLEAERLVKEQEAAMEKRRRRAQEKIDAARKAELKRFEREQELEDKKIKEMLEQKRAEQKAAEQERIRQEQERQKLLEEQQKKAEEERKKQEEKDRQEAERRRLEEEKNLVRSELGEAVGVEIPQPPEPDPPQESDLFEDPQIVAERAKAEQQKREKERLEAERAAHLKAQRQYFENKPFHKIYKEYTKNPIYAIPRLIRYLLAILFGIIPENTDNPDLKQKLAQLNQKRHALALEKEEKQKMEAYYRKYAQTFKYRFLRSIADAKFKRKRAKEMKGKPLPMYKPPVRTPEQEIAHREEIQRLYKEYHVSALERVRRWWKEFKRNHFSG